MSKDSKKFAEQREAVLAEIAEIAAKAEKEDRELTVEEISTRDALAAEAGKLQARSITAKTAEKQAKVEKAAEARNANGTGDKDANDAGGAVHVRSSERTYRKGGDVNYMQDLTAAAFGNRAASERLARHAHEMSVDALEADARIKAGSARSFGRGQVDDRYFVNQVRAGMGAAGVGEYQARTGDLSTASGAGGEFVPPAYLTSEWVPYARAGRVVADSVTNADLPPGTMSINIPKVTSGTSVATQGSQNSAVSDTALDTTFDTFPVVTIAGGQTVSQQLVDRAPIDFTDVVFKDLTLALAAQVDYKVINGPGSGDITGILNTSGINTRTWTTGSPGYPGLWNQIAATKATIADTRFMPATHMFMTPLRYEWLESQLDTNDRPLFVPSSNGPFNAVQNTGDAAVAEGVTGGVVQGLRTFQDFNIPANLGGGTNQDVVIIMKADDAYLYESPVVARALPQTYGNQLTVLLQVYEYAAFSAARYPQGVGVISGTGLVTPTFAS